MEINLAPGTKLEFFELNLTTAEGWVHLADNQWSHVAATVEGRSGKQILYLNGKKIAE